MRALPTLSAVALATFALVALRATTTRAPTLDVATKATSFAAPAATIDLAFTSDGLALHGPLLRPSGPGPFPVVVYNHGSEDDPSLQWLGDLGAWFQSHGFVAFFPYRRGASGSAGTHWKTSVDALPADQRDAATVRALELESDDVLAAIDAVAAQPFVDRDRLFVSGCSFGGIHTMLAAQRADRIAGAIDFAGASMSWASSPLLRARLLRAADDAHVPIFLLQAANDFDTTPTKVLAEALEKAGKPHRSRIFPAHGTTPMQGHAGFCTHGMSEWGDDVLAFIDETSRGSKR